MTQLSGKVALVTGGSRGIGAAIATRLAQDGSDVAVTYNANADGAALVVDRIKAAGGRGLAVPAPATDADAVANAVEQTVAEFGRLDILVNNAGVFPTGLIGDLTVEDFDAAVAVNIRAVFVACQAAAAHLGEGGRIINIGSSLADRVPEAGLSLYSLTKSSLAGFTKGLARDLGPRGITANVVHPGNTDTDMNPADREGAEVKLPRIPLRAWGRPEDVAATVAHLAGESGRYITGSAITVDGGVNA
ncbi:NAD(P)-dependent dehydrogenase (short-subunit alcohol dehydrogenase family) [Saccharopolyspora erythraea NRRL 2338]|uniref:Short-chain dehydrogenase/reductase SDR n=2 Tax=Saccharopolyspora erythraea TaxID=1836 RepID=A4FF76_SACEN|nr:3-oxoacyl-ACP reductase family protein [Saccharopolyspora erythraea]EQD86029.1 3-ketoacyl-ACP reductase [Saccharopolyspora erythraea D]PFG96425.1 NAD(P)-dependent dehydrogenase (short-subunit alcohol dehydrogenase family) [Saccharopolyspora erythraea NRRL 2338]QRK92926.1 3-oxoacyl-ACP reductase FabG [Saccharopolyspora erythraea]CAM02701.1 short-chain dehydrogenase/reductase SDR [Saccharopolyspora erythraea NRRL 2338]